MTVSTISPCGCNLKTGACAAGTPCWLLSRPAASPRCSDIPCVTPEIEAFSPAKIYISFALHHSWRISPIPPLSSPFLEGDLSLPHGRM